MKEKWNNGNERTREREREGTRERSIITTITLPPWDRFREEEKGEEGKQEGEGEEEEKEVAVIEDGRNVLMTVNEEEKYAIGG